MTEDASSVFGDGDVPEEGRDGSIILWIFENKLLVLGFVILLIPIKWVINDMRRRWFASFMQSMTPPAGAIKNEIRSDFFSSLGSIVSHDPSLRKIGAIKILEIGVGTGTNFEYYPEGTRLTVVDPNPHFIQYYNKNRKQYPNIHSGEIIVATGEEMDMIPDNSMDAVVVTLVLCSVKDVKKVLKQVLRVLTPGGKFYFYEHIKEFDSNHSTRRRFQVFLTKSGIWPFVLDNCRMDRDMLCDIETAGFSKVEAEKIHLPKDHIIWQLLTPCLHGVAQK